MSDLTERQLAVLRSIGRAADELAFRGDAIRRSITASMSHRRDCLHRVEQIANDVGRNQMRVYARTQPGTAEALEKLDKESRTLQSRVSEAEAQLDELRERQHELATFSAPLKTTFETMCKRGRVSAIDLGVPYHGMDTPREAQGDVVLTDGAGA